MRIGINGFGRMGRLALRAFFEEMQNYTNLEIVAVNTRSGDIESNAHLLQYDSTHGKFNVGLAPRDNILHMNNIPVHFFNESNPQNIPWTKLGVDLVFECTGKFKEKDDALKHVWAGAKKVLISSPSPDADIMVVYGVNHSEITSKMQVISNASCTTNCLGPIALALHNSVGVEKGFMTTIHSFTTDQNILDNNHNDWRRSRTATTSMIPTMTGAARSIGTIIPELDGKIDGTSIRVPTPNVSLIDFSFVSKKLTTVDEINNKMIEARNTYLCNIIDVVNEPLVSIDFNHNPHSAIFDLTQTQVIDGNLCRVLAWYDNEWAFSMRMLDIASYIDKLN